MPALSQFAGALIRKRSITVAAALAAALTGPGTSAASAATTHSRPVITAAHHRADNADLAEAGVCANCKPPLIYTPGGVVMGAATGTITLTPIYWTPSGYSFDNADPTYRTLINQYISDLAAASGATSNVYSILPEYYQTVNGVTTKIPYKFVAGTPLVDTDAFPATGQCTPTTPPEVTPPIVYSACITDAQTQAELKAYTAANSLPADLSHLYLLFFPPNAQTQGPGGSGYSLTQYAGYHYHTGNLIYANEPFDPGFAVSTPNGDPSADSAINTLSHEISEAVTDPDNRTGWGDSAGNEIGDECAGNYGPQLGTVSNAYGAMPYNQVINGDKYYTQTEFSNAAYKATGVGTGCRQTAYGSGGNIPRRGVRPDQAGTATQITVEASPSTLPADGSSTTTITATVTDTNGDPVAGDSVVLAPRDDIATPGTCGTLNSGYGPGSAMTTNAAGQVSATYTASTASADCYIEATDINAGLTDQALVYQGTGSTAPTITQSTLPAQLVSGGPAADFTATATNPPGGISIPDARFGVYITGDDNGATGINASQLTLSYKDDATQGDYVNVPLTGTTANGGQITGLVTPDSTEALDAGATRNAHFELTLAGNAADTATTGTNLQIQIILDQIDPADGSLSNLDATTPGGVPVTQEPGETVTYSGKLVTTSQPNGSNPGSAELEAKTCHIPTENNAACRLTGTASFTTSGGTTTGTLTGKVTTDPAPGVPDLEITFTETFTTSGGSGTGTGNAQVIYFDNGNTANENMSAVYTVTQDKQYPNIQNTQGTLTFTNPTAGPNPHQQRTTHR